MPGARAMTARHHLPGGALAAAAYYTERVGTPDEISQDEAARLHGLRSRQVVNAALRDPGRFDGSRPTGRRAAAGGLAPAKTRTIRLTDAEVAAFIRKAGPRPWSTWLAEVGRKAAGIE